MTVVREQIDGEEKFRRYKLAEKVHLGADLSVDTLAITLSGLGDLSGRQKLWFTLKSKRSDPDTSAILLVEETEGLLVLVGTEPGGGETAAITVENMESDAVTVEVSAAASRKIPPTTTGVWDLQVSDGNGVRTLTQGTLKIVADVTQRIE